MVAAISLEKTVNHVCTPVVERKKLFDNSRSCLGLMAVISLFRASFQNFKDVDNSRYDPQESMVR